MIIIMIIIVIIIISVTFFVLLACVCVCRRELCLSVLLCLPVCLSWFSVCLSQNYFLSLVATCCVCVCVCLSVTQSRRHWRELRVCGVCLFPRLSVCLSALSITALWACNLPARSASLAPIFFYYPFHLLR